VKRNVKDIEKNSNLPKANYHIEMAKPKDCNYIMTFFSNNNNLHKVHTPLIHIHTHTDINRKKQHRHLTSIVVREAASQKREV
jgi:hypothetical protein